MGTLTASAGRRMRPRSTKQSRMRSLEAWEVEAVPPAPTPDPDPDLEEISTEDMMEEVSMEEVLSTTPDGPYLIPRTAEQWAKEQLRDRDLREAIALLRGQELPEPRARRHLAPRVRSLLDLVPLLYLDPGSGALRLKKEDDQPGVPIIPLHLEEPLARLAHELAGHRGVWASTYILHLQAYALSGAATMRRIVETCWPCQVKSGGAAATATYIPDSGQRFPIPTNLH
jgi:hypothetical protein